LLPPESPAFSFHRQASDQNILAALSRSRRHNLLIFAALLPLRETSFY